MGRPNIFYKEGKWHITAKGDVRVASFDGSGMELGETGDKISKMYTFTGTSAALSTVASGVITTGTITNATGLAIGDKVFGVPKTLFDTIQVVGMHIPTTNTLNVNLVPVGDTGGSLIATAWDVVAIRGA